MTATLQTAEPTTTQTAVPNQRLVAGTLTAFRVVVSFLFLVHGVVGLFGAFGGIDGQGGSVDFGVWPDWWGSMIHLVAGALVLVGFCTRTAALLCSGSMAYAYFVVHQPVELLPILNGGELSALYSWVFLLVAVLGPGALALDNLRRRRATR